MHRLYGLTNRHLFLIVVESGKFEIRMPGWPSSGKGLFLACRQLDSDCSLTWWRERATETETETEIGQKGEGQSEGVTKNPKQALHYPCRARYGT